MWAQHVHARRSAGVAPPAAPLGAIPCRVASSLGGAPSQGPAAPASCPTLRRSGSSPIEAAMRARSLVTLSTAPEGAHMSHLPFRQAAPPPHCEGAIRQWTNSPQMNSTGKAASMRQRPSGPPGHEPPQHALGATACGPQRPPGGQSRCALGLIPPAATCHCAKGGEERTSKVCEALWGYAAVHRRRLNAGKEPAGASRATSSLWGAKVHPRDRCHLCGYRRNGGGAPHGAANRPLPNRHRRAVRRSRATTKPGA